MAYPRTYRPVAVRTSGPNFLFPIALFWGLFAVALVAWFLSEADLSGGESKFYLVPWCFATGVVVLLPSAYQFFKGKFDPFHPLILPAWSYFFPGFVIGGIVLSTGLSRPYFLTFVQDEIYNLPLTFVYVMLGFAGLIVGFVIPYGRKVGETISKYLPEWDWRNDQIPFPAMVLLGIGLGNTILGFTMGILGFQQAAEIGSYDGIIFLFSLFWLQASFLLWLYIFRAERFTVPHYAIMAILLATSFTKSAFQGNRGSLIQILVLVGFAYALSGGKFTAKKNIIGGALVTAALLLGMIYGTTFRSIKQTQEQSSIGEMADVIFATFDKVGDQDLGTTIVDGFGALAERIDSVSSLAVIVSNYEALAPYEEAWGINNNIWTETTTFFIPRAIWADKPISIEPSKYGDLYFNYSENSFTMTPMGDLLRNFGPIGVPLGMIALGFLIRILYSAFIEGMSFSYWRATIYYMLFSSISFEGTFGLILPYMLKVAAVSIVGILIVRFLIGGSLKARR